MTFQIIHKETKDVWRTNKGKHAWTTAGNAKKAWKYSDNVPKHLKKEVYRSPYNHYVRYETIRFDDQDEYEIVEIKTKEYLVQEKEMRKYKLFHDEIMKLYGQNLTINNYHLNGDTIDFDEIITDISDDVLNTIEK